MQRLTVIIFMFYNDISSPEELANDREEWRRLRETVMGLNGMLKLKNNIKNKIIRYITHEDNFLRSRIQK